jgi:hypothetical protein
MDRLGGQSRRLACAILPTDYAARLNEGAVELVEETTQVDPETAGRCAPGRHGRRGVGIKAMSQQFRDLGGEF